MNRFFKISLNKVRQSFNMYKLFTGSSQNIVVKTPYFAGQFKKSKFKIKKITILFFVLFFLTFGCTNAASTTPSSSQSAAVMQSFDTSSPQLGASLYVMPLSENPRASGNFTVTLKVDSLAQPVNAIRGALTFNKDKLEIIGVSKIGSILNLWVDEPNFSNLTGTLKFQGGVPNPGFIGNGGNVLHVIFKAKMPGITSLVWKEGEVLANDGNGTNILTNLQNLDFSVDEAIGAVGTLPATAPPQNNLLIYLNVSMLIVLFIIAVVFLWILAIKRHDRRYHLSGHGESDEKTEISEKIEHELRQFEERLMKRSSDQQFSASPKTPEQEYPEERPTRKRKKIIEIIPIAFILVTSCLLSAQVAHAQSLSLVSAKSSYFVGDNFSVALSVNTDGQSINTLSGTIAIPTDKFQITDVRYGSSIVSLWVDKPKINSSNGTITFTGGVPGGYNGSGGPILSFVLKAKKVGSAIIDLQDIKILLNDGIGTELKNISLKPLNLNISEAPVKEVPVVPKDNAPVVEEEVYIPTPDTIPPESFIPVISRHPSIENNKYFASFFAVDKDTGVSYYEAEEKPFLLSLVTDKFNKPSVKTESPYILGGQLWSYRVFVKAYDQAGNYTVGFADKPFKPIVLWIFVGILLVVTVIITRFVSNKQNSKKVLK